MKTFATKLAAIAAATVISLSGLAFADAQGIQVGLGYRQDSLKWEIRDHALINPRVKSSIHFKDLEILILGAKYKGLLGCTTYTRASFDYGWVCDGRKRERNTVQDYSEAEHFGSNGVEVSGSYDLTAFSNRTKDNSYVWDFNFGLGMPIDNCWFPELKFAPMIGFSYDRHHLKFKNHCEDRLDCSSSSSSDCSSSSSYTRDCCSDSRRQGNSFKTSFWGPWIGFDVAFNGQGCWNVFAEFELHFGRAERKQRSINDFSGIDRFGSTKDFWGPSIRLGANYMFCDCWYLEGTLSYLYWKSYGCSNHLYWNSGSARVDLGYMF
ncbi:MAG: hypothetical protein H0U49_04035 [Parachlamydiaceae bacterium]|nr:hypothetical protein [Parachlamydiaceae bacterium]